MAAKRNISATGSAAHAHAGANGNDIQEPELSKEKKLKPTPVLDMSMVKYPNVCETIGRRKHDYHPMAVFRCKTCKYEKFDAMCYACFKVCHQGHDAHFIGMRREARCDCLGSCPEQGQKPNYTMGGPAQPLTAQCGCRFRGELITGTLTRRQCQATVLIHNEDDDLVLGLQENLEDCVRSNGYKCYKNYELVALPRKSNPDESSGSDYDADNESSDRKDRNFKPKANAASDDESSGSSQSTEGSDGGTQDDNEIVSQSNSAIVQGPRNRQPSKKGAAAVASARPARSGNAAGHASGANANNSTRPSARASRPAVVSIASNSNPSATFSSTLGNSSGHPAQSPPSNSSNSNAGS